MATDDKLLVKVGVDDVEAQKRLTILDKKMEGLKTTASKLTIAGTAAFAGITVALGAAVKKFADFESGFTDVVTLLDEASFGTKTLENGIADLRSGILKLGAETGQPFESLNKGLFDLISAGVPAERAISTLTVATELAAAGATDTSVAVDGMTSSMNAFGMGADQARKVAEKLFTAQKFGKTTIAELSTNMGKAAATASATGVSFDELLASVSAATLGGIKTEAAFTNVKALLSNIQKPTADAAAEAGRLGIKFDQTALKSMGLKGFLDQVVNSAGFSEASFSKLFGSTEALGFALSVTGNQAGDFQNILGALGNESQTAATFAEALKVKQETAQKAFDKLGRSVEVVAINIGEQLAPAAIQIADKLTALAQEIASLDDEAKATILSVTKFGLIMGGTATVAATAVKAYTTIRAGLRALSVAFDVLKAKSTAAYASATLGLSILVSVGIGVLTEYMMNQEDAASTTQKTAKEITDAEKEKYAKVKEAQTKFIAEQKALREAAKKGEIKSGKDLDDKLKASREALLAKLRDINNGGVEEKKAKQSEADVAELEKIKSQDAAKAELRRASLEQERMETEAALMMIEALDQQSKERQRLFDQEFRNLSASERALYDDQARQAQLDRIKTSEDLDREAAQRKIDQQVEAHNRYLQNEREFGTAYAFLQEIRYSAGYETARTASGELSQLINSENGRLREIGKAATIVQLGISTAESAMKAFAAFAWIPVVGPGLGAAAAAAISLYGAERINTVRQMKTGGFVVPNKAGSARDRVPAILEPGELVIPRAIAQMLPPDLIGSLLGERLAMKDGGVVPGAKESKDLYKTFSSVFPVPGLFVDLVQGKTPSLTPSGFGAEQMGNVGVNMLKALGEAAAELLRLLYEYTPAGQAEKILKNAASSGAESAAKTYQSTVEAANKTKDRVKKFLGFRDGGLVMPAIGMMADRVPAMLEPGEAVLTRQTTSEVLRGERVISAGGAGSGGQQTVLVELELKGDLGRIVRARQREQSALGV